MSRVRMNVFVFGLQLCAIAFSFPQCDARRSKHFSRGHNNLRLKNSNIQRSTKKIVVSNHLDDASSNTLPYGVGSPFTIPPYDSLPPVSWPDQTAPPFCIDSPFMPLPPPSGGGGSGGGYTPLPPPSSSSNPTPTFPNPPPGPDGSSTGPSPSNPGTGSSPPGPNTSLNPNPPITIPSPPSLTPNPTGPGLSPPSYYEPSPPILTPSPTEPGLSPPSYYEPSPPILTPSPTEPGLSPPSYYEPSPPPIVIPRPPSTNPSPSIFIPSPPVFQPPVVYPPPAVPPPPKSAHSGALWCVAKPTVPDPIIQEAMNYACGSGGDCGSIQPNGLCFQPDTLYAHASYAFNSYWQRTKVAGGTCDFGGTAMLVTVDPSYDGCHFIIF